MSDYSKAAGRKTWRLPILLFAMLIQFYACETETVWDIDGENQDLLVVNGLITNEKKVHKIILSLPVSAINEIAKPATGATASIYDGDSLHSLQEDLSKPGTYKTNADFRAVINKPYTLIIIYNKRRYYSSVYMYPVRPFNILKYQYNAEKQIFCIDSVTMEFNTNESAMYEIIIDWTAVDGYDTIPMESKKAILYYYMLSTIDISEVFAPKKEKVYFPAGTKIVESKYSLTPEHAGFIRSMLLETEWRGGLFDVAHGNVKTNLSEGAVGYFAVSTVIRDSLFVK